MNSAKYLMVKSRHTQRGMTMIVGMIMLLLLTVIGLAAIRGASLEERMAGNQRDRTLAFQSAEAALRAAEIVMNGAALPTWNTTGYGVQVTRGGNAAFWDSFNWSGSAIAPSLSLPLVNAQPRYYVERISSQFTGGGSGTAIDFESQTKVDPETMYRITSRAVGASPDTVVILQSTYKR